VTTRKRRNGRWFFRRWVRRPDGTKVRISGVPGSWGLPNTRGGAEEAERLATNNVRNGLPTKPVIATPSQAAFTVRGFAETFLSTSENKRSYLDSKASALRVYILPALGDMPMSSVTYALVEDFKASLRKRKAKRGGGFISDKTVHNILVVLHRMLKVAAKRQLIASVPDFEWPKFQRPKVDFLDFDEADRLVAAAQDEWRTMILLALHTGMRQGELLGLRWEDSDLVAGRITVRHALVRGRSTNPKNHQEREIPLNRVALPALKAHRHLRGPLVFCQLDGSPWTANQAWGPLRAACKRAGLRTVGWHVLRHSFASHLVMRGASLTAVRELMGHATLAMTLRYSHLSPQVRRETVDLLGTKAPDLARKRQDSE
jgi:integrase